MFTNKVTQVSYKNDVFFKFALSSQDESSKMIRHFIIKEVTGIEPLDSVVLNGEIIPEKMFGKKIVLDVHVKDIHGNNYDIEMQMSGSRNAVSMRFEYYGAKILANQIEEGIEYERLKPVYQIIFMDSYAPENRDLIDAYQMYNQKGQVESSHALLHRTYIHLPVINDIYKEKGLEEMSGFEKICYLFKNNENSVIMKTKESVVRKLMEKYEKMKKDKPVFTLAESIEMGEWQARMIEKENKRIAEENKRIAEENKKKAFQEGVQEGIEEGIREGKVEGISMILKQIVYEKYGIDASKWLSTLQSEQLENISSLLLTTSTFEELQQSIK